MTFFSRNFFVVTAVALLSACSAENSSDEPAASLADADIEVRAGSDQSGDAKTQVAPEKTAPSTVPENKKPKTVELSFTRKDVVQCVPGCRLENDEAGRPVVPEWCITWQPEAPYCNRNEDGNIACHGYWFGENLFARYTLRGEINEHTEFHLYQSEYHEARIKEIGNVSKVRGFVGENTKFVCTQIDRGKIAINPTDVRALMLAGEEVRAHDLADLSCRPGCIVGDEPVFPKKAVGIPDWCQRFRPGYGYSSAEIREEVQRCMGIYSGLRKE